MADGEITVKVTLSLSEAAARNLQAGADRLGVAVEAYAADVIERHVFSYDDFDWGQDPVNDPRVTSMPPVDPDEPTYPAKEVLSAFRTELERRLAAKV
ncbi:MAG: hypothetical protein U1C74_08345 [Phenylobacterium sp.]|nr:hypothetical protein [Phenylobacterium sp.]